MSAQPKIKKFKVMRVHDSAQKRTQYKNFRRADALEATQKRLERDAAELDAIAAKHGGGQEEEDESVASPRRASAMSSTGSTKGDSPAASRGARGAGK